MDKNSKIYIAGHNGLVGSAILSYLKQNGFNNIYYASRKHLDLTKTDQVNTFFKRINPEYVFLCAAKVGGIFANNSYPVEFLNENLSIQNNIINSCYEYNVKKLLFLGSSCIYPKNCPQPIKEEYLMTGELEQTNSAYAIAKIAGIELCKSYNKEYNTNFITAMPTNLYGKNDNFDLNTSHVLPALIRKFYEAKKDNKKEVVLFGTGEPRREFLYVEDLAEACVLLMNEEKNDFITNIGYGEDITIKDLALLIKDKMQYEGNIVWDTTKPNGTMQKLLNTEKINKIWKPKTSLTQGLDEVIKSINNKGI